MLWVKNSHRVGLEIGDFTQAQLGDDPLGTGHARLGLCGAGHTAATDQIQDLGGVRLGGWDGPPIAGSFRMETQTKMDDNWGHPGFRNPHLEADNTLEVGPFQAPKNMFGHWCLQESNRQQ